MKKKFLSMLLSVAMVVTMFSGTIVNAAPEADSGSESLGMNVALKATADASYTNKYVNGPQAMNDGELATADAANTSWNSWGGGDEAHPVTTMLKWDVEHSLSSMRVIWWADNATLDSNANVTFPKSCKFQYIVAEGNPQVITGMVD